MVEDGAAGAARPRQWLLRLLWLLTLTGRRRVVGAVGVAVVGVAVAAVAVVRIRPSKRSSRRRRRLSARKQNAKLQKIEHGRRRRSACAWPRRSARRSAGTSPRCMRA